MQFTNVHNLPDPIVRALTFDGYDVVGDISVTSLLRPTQVAALEVAHEHEITEDVSERVWQVWGSATHEVLYRATDKENVIAEKRLTMDVAGWTVSGKADIYDLSTRVISDYKTSSAWSVVFDPQGRKEHQAQLNIYRLLFEANGYPVDGLRLVMILRDWQERDKNRTGYPQIPIHVIDVPVWDRPFAEKFLENRVKAHQAASEGAFEECTDEDRWLNKGVYTRCERYCKVAQWCRQHNG